MNQQRENQQNEQKNDNEPSFYIKLGSKLTTIIHFGVILFGYLVYSITYLFPLITDTYQYSLFYVNPIQVDNWQTVYNSFLKSQSTGQQVKGLILFIILHVLLFLYAYSVYKTMNTPAGSVPAWYNQQQQQKKDELIRQEDQYKEAAEEAKIKNQPPLTRNSHQLLNKGNKSMQADEETDEEYVNYSQTPQETNQFIKKPEIIQQQLKVPENSEQMKKLKAQHFKKMLKQNHDLRFCNKCQYFKPPRTHHCSACGECYLKMDHHCFWINQCIGYKNYKYFINMLTYISLVLMLVSFSYSECFVDASASKSVSGFQFYIIAVNFLLVLTLFLIVCGFTLFHYWLISQNKSTIEYCESKRDGIVGKYDLGCVDNFNQSLGKNWWFCPFDFNSEYDGIQFQVKPSQNQNQDNKA